MRFTKPSWVCHTDSQAARADPKRLSIFSVHVHPDGSRIATGGLDAKVRIWSTKPILNKANEESNKPPKSLCTLGMHTGPVLVVRWAHSGRWLASGSDDAIVMVWDLDPAARGKVWGSDEINVEGWKPLKRLPGHESDVTDVAWSPGDRYLASVGLDSAVFIWCGFTLERLCKLDQHQGFVKGVCWDPVGEFLATQSDDRTVKIWRTTDWSLEAEVTKPFEDSPGSTFFRRLSWSPDGAHITASNATNNKGFVFIAAVIARNTWASEISLVGHENTVEVACYNPHIFLRDPSQSIITANICSVVALGADDRSVSVWQTKSARPLIVATEVFERSIMDLSWSWDGLTLYAVSSDGTLAVFDFDTDELQGIAPHSAQEQYLQKFGFVPPPIPEGYSHNSMSNLKNDESSQSQTGFGAKASTGERVHVLVAKKKDKRRIQPSAVPSASIEPPNKRLFITEPTRDSPSLPASPIVRANNRPLGTDVTMAPIDTIDTSTVPASTGKGKRKLTDPGEGEPKATRPRTLGGDVQRPAVTVVRELHISTPITNGSNFGIHDVLLKVPPVLTYVQTEVEGSDDTFEGRNFESEDAPPEVTYSSGKQTQWLDYLHAPILAMKATSAFCAVALQDGSLIVYSPMGRRLMPTITLGSPCHILEGNKSALMAITCTGQLYCWNLKKQSTFFPPVTVSSLLANSPNTQLVSAAVRANGVPIVNTSNGMAHSYDSSLQVWTRVGDRWWSSGSDAWQSRQRGQPSTITSRTTNIVSVVETSVGSIDEDTGFWDSGSANKLRPQWWSTAMTLGHLETKLHAAKLLDSPQEYKQVLLVYAKKIADEAFRAKAEELIKELFGPLYWRPGRDDGWFPSVLGMQKRDLLKDVLSIFARSKTLTKMAQDWQETLKKAMTED